MGTQTEETTEVDIESGGVSLGDDGELVFSDDFFEEFEPEKTEKTEETQEPAKADEPSYYSPAEMADAFAAGNLDVERLRPDVREYYTTIMERQRAAEEVRQPVQQQPVQQMPQPPQVVDMGKLREAAKKVAAQVYLKIPEGEFDEFDPAHAQAQNLAMLEIRDRALEMHRQEAARQQEVYRLQGEAQRKQDDIRAMYGEFQKDNPDLGQIDAYFAEWRGGLPAREAEDVDAAIQSGELAKVRLVVSRLIGDYRKAKGGGSTEPVKKEAPKAPPKVESSAGGTDKEDAGVMDIAGLGEMTAEEQVEALLKLGIV